MLRVLCNAICWRRAPHIGQACLFPPSALFANMNPAPLEGHAHASKSSQDTHLGSQARWSRSRCSFPDRTGRLPSRRSQRPSVCLYDSPYVLGQSPFSNLSPFIHQVIWPSPGTLAVDAAGPSTRLERSREWNVFSRKLWEVEDYTDLATPCPRNLTITLDSHQ